jgi:hypothetical protein
LKDLIEDFLLSAKERYEEYQTYAKRQNFINRGETHLERAFIAIVYDYVVKLGDDAKHMNDVRLWRLINDEHAFYEGWRSPLKVAAVSQLSVLKTFEFFRDIVRVEVGLEPIGNINTAELPQDTVKKELEL